MAKCDDQKCGYGVGSRCACGRKFFKNIFTFVEKVRAGEFDDQDRDSFCNFALDTGMNFRKFAAVVDNPNHLHPCRMRYPWQRYYQLNLAPLIRFGSIEFRAHSATYDEERVLRWTKFLLAFVEHFSGSSE